MTSPTLDQRLRHQIYAALAHGARAPTAASLAVTFAASLAIARLPAWRWWDDIVFT